MPRSANCISQQNPKFELKHSLDKKTLSWSSFLRSPCLKRQYNWYLLLENTVILINYDNWHLLHGKVGAVTLWVVSNSAWNCQNYSQGRTHLISDSHGLFNVSCSGIEIQYLTTVHFSAVFPFQVKQLWEETPDSSPCLYHHLPPLLRHLPPRLLPSPATGRDPLQSAPPRGSWAGTRETATWTTTSMWQRWVDCLLHSCEYTHRLKTLKYSSFLVFCSVIYLWQTATKVFISEALFLFLTHSITVSLPKSYL